MAMHPASEKYRIGARSPAPALSAAAAARVIPAVVESPLPLRRSGEACATRPNRFGTPAEKAWSNGRGPWSGSVRPSKNCYNFSGD